ncbi:HIT family protein [Citricoccus muralis]|uniref:Diadenosine tetraphosphate (Ap4A) HIT family hydrolase n=1 Tax=Citricoccus muralis TaxID=169134 RepID=A0A3D9L9W6_9MICC|nr:HIT family protein [Citricoccus muralis]REE02650.1 diadenosine tetraphosphate (Ap4A) HIT family hydrolase [Citricoccus muralis]
MSTVFTRIINGELPGRFVWKDETCVAFLSIGPLTQGHTLVVPRAEVDLWTEAEPELVSHLMTVAQAIGQVQVQAFNAHRAGLMVAGYEIPHLHVHVWPSNSLDDFDLDQVDNNPEPEDLDEAADRIRAGLRVAGHTEYVPED